MSADATTIVLCGGPINYTNLPIGTNLSNAMIPVNGKPVIGWILDDLLSKNLLEVVVVLRQQDERLRNFLTWAYHGRLHLRFALLGCDGTIVQSLQAGLKCVHGNGLVRIILGDTLICDAFEGADDFVYVGKVQDSRRWCLVVPGEAGEVERFLDKKESVRSPKLALAGYYHLQNGAHLRRCVEDAVANDESELSDVLHRYAETCPIRIRKVRSWFDFGHIDNLTEARRRLLKPRAFNSIRIHPVLNTLTKVSKHDGKLQDELDWYLDIPDTLKVLSPRIVDHRRVNGHLEIVQEYYGYPTLAELYVYADLHADTWVSILSKIIRVHQEFRRYTASLDSQAVRAMYLDKTLQRLETWRQQDPKWAHLFRQDTVTYNGHPLRNVLTLKARIREKIYTLAESAEGCVIHGDLCFSNILFDVNHQIIRLIDPRGRFGSKGIYGDPRYDMAKLRHSVCGLYDFIMAGLFELRGEGRVFEGRLYVNGVPKSVGLQFDRLLRHLGYDLDDIRFIEGLLFLSMLPLHHDSPSRQLMMFLTGLARLNEVL